MRNSPTADSPITRGHSYILAAAAGMTYLLITMGGMVCVTESGRGCPDWPGCYGQIIPPLQGAAIVEYLHRFTAALTSPLIILAAWTGWRRARALPWVSRPPLLAVFFVLAVIVFGALAVLRGIPPVVAALDLGSALIVLALLVTAAVVAFWQRHNPELRDGPSFRSPFAALALVTAAAVFLVLVSAVLVAEPGSATRCLGWPLYNSRAPLVDLRGWLDLARQLLAGATSLLIVGVVVLTWRSGRGQHGTARAAVVAGLLFLVESAVGVLLMVGGLNVVLQIVYVAAAAGLWSALVVLAVLAGLTAPGAEEGRVPAIKAAGSAV